MDFNQMKCLLVRMLGDFKVKGKPADVLMEFTPGEKLPAITMNSIGGRGHIQTLVYKNMSPLQPDHLYFDLQAPETKYNTGETYEHHFNGKLLLHIWSETNEERDILVDEVYRRILENKNKGFGEDISVQIREIGSSTDIDQFDSYPPLFHTTIELEFLYIKTNTVKVAPLCSITAQRSIWR